MSVRATTGTPPVPPGAAGGVPPRGRNVMVFTDEFAPVWTDPDTGVRKPMTSTAWRAAGFTVHPVPGYADLYAVNLDSRARPIEPPVHTVDHDPGTGRG